MWQVWAREEMHRGFWVGKQSEKEHLEDLGVNG